jgi:hypothetical protein
MREITTLAPLILGLIRYDVLSYKGAARMGGCLETPAKAIRILSKNEDRCMLPFSKKHGGGFDLRNTND